MRRNRSLDTCLKRVRPKLNSSQRWLAAFVCAAVCLQVVETSADITLSSSTLTQAEQSLQGTSLLSIQTNRGGASADWGLFSATANLPQQHDQGSPQPSPHYAFVKDRAVSSAMVTDMVAIRDPSRTGTLGYFVPVVAVTRVGMSARAAAPYTTGIGGEFSRGDAGFTVNVQGVELFGAIVTNAEQMLRGIQAPQTVTMSPVPFIFGESFLLHISSSAGASFEAYGGDIATAAASATGAASVNVATVWGGFQSITDENGNVVTGAVVTSDTGIDWSNPAVVPWRGSTGTDFATGSNWYFGNKPNSSQTAYLGNATTATITNVSGESNRLVAASGDTSLFISTYNLSSNLADVPGLLVGHLNQEEATLRLVSGQTTAMNTVIADVAGSAGNLYVSGSNSSLDVSELLVVGDSGTGSLNATEGAQVEIGTLTIAGKPGSALSYGKVSDIGSQLTVKALEVGKEDSGRMDIEDGAEVSAENVSLGLHPESKGDLDIIGEGSKLTMERPAGGVSKLVVGVGGVGHVTVDDHAELNAEEAEVIVGHSNHGVIDIYFGSQFQAASVQLGDEIGSGEFNVTDHDTTVDISGRLDAYEGSMRIDRDAVVRIGELRAGLRGESAVTLDGEANLTIGPSTELVALKLGGAAQGTLELGSLRNEGATLVVNGETTIGNTGPGLSELSLVGADSTATFNGLVTVGGVGTGLLLVGQNSRVIAPAGIAVQALGTLSGRGRVTGDVDSLGGSILPGSSPGTLTIEGNLTLDSASLLGMEIAGTSPEQFDVLAVTGVTQLGGTLRLIFRDGFAPHTGDVFDLFDGPSALGAFDAVEVLGLEPGWQYSLDQSSLRVTSLNDGVSSVPEPATLCLISLGLLVSVTRLTRC